MEAEHGLYGAGMQELGDHVASLLRSSMTRGLPVTARCAIGEHLSPYSNAALRDQRNPGRKGVLDRIWSRMCPRRPVNQPSSTESAVRPSIAIKLDQAYPAIACSSVDTSVGRSGTACGRMGRSQPAESHDRGIENSDQPQSKQALMSGEGVMGGWLRVRGRLR
jgi:hypothetical protein